MKTSTTSLIRTFATACAAASLSLAACPGGGGSGIDTCANGIQDILETGVDCGSFCGLCPGEACTVGAACASDVCAVDTCAAPTCADGLQNGVEVGVDCGGGCGPCLPASCANSVQDPGEQGVDCGGSCLPCGDPCTNGTQDTGEDGVDCGGTCPTACDAAPTCTDSRMNQDETDVDCGGQACPACATGKLCGGGADCVTLVCTGGMCADVAATCSNNMKEPGESDVDCGGGCPACALTKFCNTHTDCLSATCIFGVCMAPTCSDDVQNQGETDLDCGGSKCPGCDDGELCLGDDDCASEACGSGGTCVSCEDSALNGQESDVDCGGPVCEACDIGDSCNTPDDCDSMTCIAGSCVAEGTSAGMCTTEKDCIDGFFCDLTLNAAEDGLDRDCLAEDATGNALGAPCGDEGCAGFQCVNGFCSAVCASDAECAATQQCVPEEFFFDTDNDNQVDLIEVAKWCLGFTSPTGACKRQADCTSAQRCNAYLVENAAAGGLDSDAPYTVAGTCEAQLSSASGYGAFCDTNADCASGLCSSQGVCSTLCSAAAECPTMVINGQTAQAVCSASALWGGGGLDDPTRFVRISRCIAINGSGTDCGPSSATPFVCADADEGCAVAFQAFGPTNAASVEHICVPNGGGTTPVGGTCNPENQDCASGLCLTNETTNMSYCSQNCSDATPCPDAPQGQPGVTCQPDDAIVYSGKYASNGVTLNLCMQ